MENELHPSENPANTHQYTEDAIKTLSSLDHIRLRPGMYIGRMGDGSHPDDGIYILLKEIIDNSIDEFIMGVGRRIDIELEADRIAVRDYGRGIPLGKLVECVSVINTGGKYNDDVFQFSIGLNGVGTKAVNALSDEFMVKSFRDGRFHAAFFRRGLLEREEEGESDEKNGTLVRFVPDRELFSEFSFRREYVEKRLWMYVYLNSGLSIYCNGERYFSKNGLCDLLEAELPAENRLYDVISYKGPTMEFALAHSDFTEAYYSFVNGQFTHDGGTHLSAFREGVLKAINEFSGRNYQASDVRDGLFGAIAIKLKSPIFESQTKNKLGNTDVRTPIVNTVRDQLVDFLHKNKDTAEILLDKINRNEQLRRQMAQVKKQSREKARKMSLRIPKLNDCKFHRGDRALKEREAMIFLTEGDSAAGSMISCRDPYTQAVFSLKGKPLNCYGEKRDRIYENEEFFYIVQSLDIDDDIDNLRYDKVVIATDADVDGMHIRNLLITFFLSYFEPLVLSGHLYVLETPLFRVRNKKETFYCYNLAEREAAMEKLKTGVEITRFKGLGEISPKEFAAFIGQGIRLLPITLDNMVNVQQMLGFYMGKNDADRKEYIMNNLRDSFQ